MADWWKYYADGKIVRREDTPQSICSTLEDWCVQCCLPKNNPMWMFPLGKPVEPRKLQQEIAECIVSGDQVTPKQRKELKALEVWIIREAALAEAVKELREARKTFGQAVVDAGLDLESAYRVHQATEG